MALFNIYYVLRQLDLTYKYCACFNLFLVVVVGCRCRSYSFFVFCSNFIIILFHFIFFAFLVVVLTNIIVVVICLSAVFFFFLHNKFLDVFCVCPRFFCLFSLTAVAYCQLDSDAHSLITFSICICICRVIFYTSDVSQLHQTHRQLMKCCDGPVLLARFFFFF